MHIIPSHITPTRLSDYAVGIFPTIPSRKGIKKAIKRGEIWIDGQLGYTGTWVQAGQCLELRPLDRLPPKIYHMKLPIVYEDDQLAIIHKPAGIPVSGNQFRTIINALCYNLSPSQAKDALHWPKPVHRLDVPTSGLLLIAKTASAIMHLGQQFEQKLVQKEYRAVVVGELPESGMINQAIEGKDAVTTYQVLEKVSSLRNQHLSLVALFPQTGRTHQLRIHLAHLGHPIFGDQLYGEVGQVYKGKGLFLAAVALAFIHPSTKEHFKSSIPIPPKFTSLLKREQRRFSNFYSIIYALIFLSCLSILSKVSYGQTNISPKIIVIGIDGLSVDGVQKANTPNMDVLLSKGSTTLSAQAVLPTKSSPNWMSMLSGVDPDKHRIKQNGFEASVYQNQLVAHF